MVIFWGQALLWHTIFELYVYVLYTYTCSSNIVRHTVWAHDVHGYKQLLCPVMPLSVRPSTYPHYN